MFSKQFFALILLGVGVFGNPYVDIYALNVEHDSHSHLLGSSAARRPTYSQTLPRPAVSARL